jgi:DNA modification methylase
MILRGDCLHTLRTLPDKCVQTVTTSPPFYNLRVYAGGAQDQLGQESTPEAYIQNLVTIFREVKRVLRDDGTCWIEIGDSYAGSGRGPTGKTGIGNQSKRQGFDDHPATIPEGMKEKDLIGIPWMLAFALRADGWYLRRDVINAKKNPQPESVKDRPTAAHTYIFLLSKSPTYYYDAEAIAEPCTESSLKKNPGCKRNKRDVWFTSTGRFKGSHFATFAPELIDPCVKAGTSEHGACPVCHTPFERVLKRVSKSPHDRSQDGRTHSTAAQRMGKESCPEKGWETETTTLGWLPQCQCRHVYAQNYPALANDSSFWPLATESLLSAFISLSISPCIVLDPFFGSGTTAVVAMQNHCDFIGCEISEEYAEMAMHRIIDECPWAPNPSNSTGLE